MSCLGTVPKRRHVLSQRIRLDDMQTIWVMRLEIFKDRCPWVNLNSEDLSGFRLEAARVSIRRGPARLQPLSHHQAGPPVARCARQWTVEEEMLPQAFTR